MLCDGEKLRIPSTNERPQNMGEMLLIPGNNNSENNNTDTNNNKNASTATSNSSTSTNSNMIHAAAAPSAARVMDKPAQDHQAALKCPRCDSSNTKFCYYNNYSLSQPRHFCKACKRYWTRGGTLRNVPVGGGCRKNKRVKKPTSTAASDPLPSALMPPTNSVPPISLPNPASHLDSPMNPLFYSLPTASSSSGLAFSGLRAPSVPHGISIPCTGFDLPQPQLNSLGLGFPSSQSQSQRDDEFHLSQLQTSASVMNDHPLFGSTAASLLLSSLRQPKKLEDYQALMPYEELHAASAEAIGNLGVIKEVKLEGDSNAIDHNRIEWPIPLENSFDAIIPAASTSLAGDSSFLYWNSAIGAWPDSAHCESSVAPLI
ncbi:uncharacterized protein [Elaeis guineensis]|uniref:Dof zinc finger protein n=1 Tax=Elaeis guineensis var. tenera TaxID=51953 RepID=A0A6I9RN12_ELAGV|nr:dof zinc finger protein DOF1.4 isoform X2 [Elaeis guineensis]